MSTGWLALAMAVNAVVLLSAALRLDRRQATRRHPAALRPLRPSMAHNPTTDPGPARILVVGTTPTDLTDGHSIGHPSSHLVEAAHAAAQSRKRATVETLYIEPEQQLPPETTRRAHLVILALDSPHCAHAARFALGHGTHVLAAAPITDDRYELEELQDLATTTGTRLADVVFGSSAALAQAATTLLGPGEEVTGVELHARVTPGASHYLALDELLLAAAATAPHCPTHAWQLQVTAGTPAGIEGFLATEHRKIHWRHDGEIGTALAPTDITPEIERSTELRVRVDPVHQFRRAIDDILDRAQRQPLATTEALLRARDRWWGPPGATERS